MPELPDVEVFKRYLDVTALHQAIAKTSVRDPDILGAVSAAKLQRVLKNERYTSSRRHGKYLFVAMGKRSSLVLHFGMTGFLKYFKNASDAPSHTRLLIEFKNGYHLAYDCMRKLGEVELVDSVEEFIKRRELGPDALDPRLDLAAFRGILGQARGGVKSTLMNQKRIAGIGNVYSDEILFHAGIHPASRSDRLDNHAEKQLHRAMKHTLQKAIDYQADPRRFPGSYLLPHRVGDRKCPRCGRKLRQKKISGRSAYYCAKEQKQWR